MGRTFTILFAIFIALIVVVALGPRPAIDGTVTFDANAIPDDVEGWLKAREAAVPGITPGAEKEIVWADPATRARTPLAVVYLHGFSATKWEVRPLPDRVATAIGANLFFTRLTGHGQDGEALAAASMNDWVNDLAEAIAIGERIGEHVVLIGTSTGGTLATFAVSNPRLIEHVAGMTLISPNFEINGAANGLLNMPWGNLLLPLALGRTRSFEPSNEQHAKWWTTSYPSVAIFPMAALLKAVEDMGRENTTVPAFFIFSPQDTVVSAAATRRMYERWRGDKRILEVESSGDDDNHVIAGDIMSPENTEPFTKAIVEWIGTLRR